MLSESIDLNEANWSAMVHSNQRLGVIVFARLVSIALLMSLACICAVPAFALPSTKPLSKDWQLVAKSDIVAWAKINTRWQDLDIEKAKKSGYFSLSAAVVDLAKGKSVSPINVREPISLDWFATGPSSKRQLITKEVLVFLHFVDEFNPHQIYFTDGSAVSLRAFNSYDLRQIKSEVANQSQIVEHFKEFPLARVNSSDEEVRTLLTQLTVKQTQDDAWEKLLRLPKSSIPALVRAMDDRRALASPAIVIPTKPGPRQFEALAHYGPKIILDAVSILLNDKADCNFGQIYNGGSERERQTVLNAWKVWAYYNLRSGAAVSKSAANLSKSAGNSSESSKSTSNASVLSKQRK
jgi:hypothetical protein